MIFCLKNPGIKVGMSIIFESKFVGSFNHISNCSMQYKIIHSLLLKFVTICPGDIRKFTFCISQKIYAESLNVFDKANEHTRVTLDKLDTASPSLPQIQQYNIFYHTWYDKQRKREIS